jgi:Flp pilus assembly protein CpaB
MITNMLSPQRATVYLFNDAYPAGTTISTSMFVSVHVDANMVSANVKAPLNQRFVTRDEFAKIISSGDSLKIDVGKGMPLMGSMLSVTGGNSIEMLMKPSAMAVTIPVNSVRGVTSELEAGSHVNIYYTGINGTNMLFENMRVLDVGLGNAGTITSATIEVSHAEAALLINAAENGSLYLSLINQNGYQSYAEYQASIATPTPETTPEPTPEPEVPAEPEVPVEPAQPEEGQGESAPENP